MADMIGSGGPLPKNQLTEFERKRALSSFQNMFELAQKKPEAVFQLVTSLAQDPEAYPTEMAVAFVFGYLQSSLGTACGYSSMHLLDQLIESHKGFFPLKPTDFFGSKRKFGKTGLYPVDPSAK